MHFLCNFSRPLEKASVRVWTHTNIKFDTLRQNSLTFPDKNTTHGSNWLLCWILQTLRKLTWNWIKIVRDLSTQSILIYFSALKNDCFWPCFPCRCMEEFKQIATISEKYSGNIREILRLSPFSITDWLPSAQKPSFITFFYWNIYMEIEISSIVNIVWIASPPEINPTQQMLLHESITKMSYL